MTPILAPSRALASIIRRIRKTKNFRLAMAVYRTADTVLRLVHSLQTGVERLFRTKLPMRLVQVHGVRSRGYRGGLLRLSPFAKMFSHVALPTADGSFSITPDEGPISSLYIIDNDPSRRITMFEQAAGTGADIIFFGSEDCTFPHQTDIRWRSSTRAEVSRFKKAIGQSSAQWFVENLDAPVPGVTAIPGGLLGNGPLQTWRVVRRGPIEHKSHQGKILLISHRIRSDPQYDARRKVTRLGEADWSGFSHVVRPVEDENLTGSEMDITEWRNLAGKFSFVACVEGGGLSPSPKFFDVLLAKAFPIIRESAMSSVHEKLPCVVIPAWDSDYLSEGYLLDQFQILKAEWGNWSNVHERLSQRYWADYVFALHSP